MRRRAAVLLLAAFLALPVLPAGAQRLLIGRWQGIVEGTATAVALTIITADSDGSLHGTVAYEPPLDGLAGAPFTTRIVNGSFGMRFSNGSRYEDLHWCGTLLCGTYVTLDGTEKPARFDRPAR